MHKIPKIAISVGEPSGVGPDILIQTCAENKFVDYCASNHPTVPIAFCDTNLLYQRANKLNLNIEIINLDLSDIEQLETIPSRTLYVVDNIKSKDNKHTAELTLEYLRQATYACFDKKCNALVTCPIQKSIINIIDPGFTGHTEYLEDLCNQHYQPTQKYKSIMMLMGPTIKTALVTTHIPLSQVAQSITKEKIITIAKTLNSELKRKFNIDNPHILTTGLNPHAGENGNLGMEEIEVITPAIEELKQNNIHISGPYAADSIFSKSFADNEIILAMYHDQGLTGFKAKAFNKSANITLGLPLIRTSVDHGTALELAGTGKANTGSFEYALKSAANIHNSQRYES